MIRTPVELSFRRFAISCLQPLGYLRKVYVVTSLKIKRVFDQLVSYLPSIVLGSLERTLPSAVRLSAGRLTQRSVKWASSLTVRRRENDSVNIRVERLATLS